MEVVLWGWPPHFRNFKIWQRQSFVFVFCSQELFAYSPIYLHQKMAFKLHLSCYCTFNVWIAKIFWCKNQCGLLTWKSNGVFWSWLPHFLNFETCLCQSLVLFCDANKKILDGNLEESQFFDLSIWEMQRAHFFPLCYIKHKHKTSSKFWSNQMDQIFKSGVKLYWGNVGNNSCEFSCLIAKILKLTYFFDRFGCCKDKKLSDSS